MSQSIGYNAEQLHHKVLAHCAGTDIVDKSMRLKFCNKLFEHSLPEISVQAIF